jgi:hypothetical protein
MKPGLSTLVAICLTGVAVTAVQAQPQVVVQDKLPAGAADAPLRTPSPEVLRQGVTAAVQDAQYRAADAAKLAENLADADVILRIPVRITGFDLSRMPKQSREGYQIEPERFEVRLECDVSAVGVLGHNNQEDRFGAYLSVVLTPRITNGALDMVQEFGLPFRKWSPGATSFRNVGYLCKLVYGLHYSNQFLCTHNAAGTGNLCRVEGEIPTTF